MLLLNFTYGMVACSVTSLTVRLIYILLVWDVVMRLSIAVPTSTILTICSYYATGIKRCIVREDERL